MKIVLGYTLLYFVIIFNAIWLTEKLKKCFCKTLAIAILSTVVELYIFGLIGILKYGVYLICIANIGLGLYTILKNIVKNSFKDMYFNKLKGLGIFTIIYMIFGFTTYNKVFAFWDELTLWSVGCKNMYILDDFITNPKCTFFMPYPPNPTILQYFFCKVIGIYSQGIELFASEIFGFALIMPLFEKSNDKCKKIILFIIMLCIPAIFCESFFYYTIYVDTLLGLLIGYSLYSFFELKNKQNILFNTIEVILSIMVISLTKTSGIFISLILIGIFGLSYILDRFFYEKGKIFIKKVKTIFLKKEFLFFFILIIMCLGIYFTWQCNIKINKANERNVYKNENTYEGSKINYIFETTVNSISGDSKNDDNISLKNLFYDLFEKKYYSSNPVDFSAGTWFCLFMIMAVIVYMNKNEEKKYIFKHYAISIGVGLVMYICFLQVAYMIEFTNVEAIDHSSLQRYIGTFLLAILLFFIRIIVNDFSEKKYSTDKYVILLAAILAFTPISPIANATITSGTYNILQQENLEFDKNISNSVKEKISEDSKVYPVHQTSNSDTHLLRFQYFMVPIKIPTTDIFTENESNNSKISVKNVGEWKNLLYNEYDYVFILKLDKFFVENYSEVFENEKVKEWTLYRIDKQNTEVKLVEVK